MKQCILLMIFLFAQLQAKPLNLKECIDIALDQNPSVRAAQEGVIMANESIGIAKAPYFPDLRFHASYARFQTHLFFPPIPSLIPIVDLKIPSILGPFNDWEININSRYLLYDFGYRQAQLLAAKALKGLAQEEEARIYQEIILNVSLAFYALAADLEMVEVAKQSFARSEDHVKMTQDKNNVGSVPFADLLRAQVNLANARQALVKSNSTVRIATGNLNAYMGLPPETPLTILIDPEHFIPPHEINLCEALSEAENGRPEMKAVLFKIQALRNQISQSKAAYGPKIIAQGSYGRCDDEFYPQDPDWSFGVTFELPLFEGFDTRHRVSKAEAELRQAFAEYDTLLLSVKQNVWNAHANLLETYESIQATKAQVENSLESLRLVKERYQVGASILTDLLDVETVLTSSQANLVDAHWRYQSAYRLFLWSQGK